MISDQQRPIDSGFGAKSEPSEVLEGVDLSGKVAVVTGGYSGIGLETVRALVDCGARAIVPARRVEAAQEILAGLVHPKDVLYLDLGDVASVNTFVDDFLAMDLAVDILINNAGIMACAETRTNKGWELQFAANHLGHFVLTTGLVPALQKSAAARVVTLSSAGHKLSGVRWSDIHVAEAYDKWAAYGQSKTAACLFAVEFDARMKSEGIRSFSVHPGGILTPLQRHLGLDEMIGLGWVGEDGELTEMSARVFKTPSQGASTTLWAATSTQLDGYGGLYCEDCDVAAMHEDGPHGRYRGVMSWAVDTDEASKLWLVTEELLLE